MEKVKGGQIIIGGYSNARTSREEGVWDKKGGREIRKSLDEIRNEEEKELIEWVNDKEWKHSGK